MGKLGFSFMWMFIFIIHFIHYLMGGEPSWGSVFAPILTLVFVHLIDFIYENKQ